VTHESIGAPQGNRVAALVTPITGGVRRRARLFIDGEEQPRARRATDVLLVVSSLVGLVFVGVLASPEPGFARAVADLLRAFPNAFDGVWQIFADLPFLLGGLLLVATIVRRRFPIARDVILALIISATLWMLLGRIVVGNWPSASELLSIAGPPAVFPAARLSIPGAIIMTASPHLVRPARRAGRWVLVLGALGTVALGSSDVLGVVAALLASAVAAGLVHLILGSSAGRPSLEDVRYALGDLGVRHGDLGVAARQDAGHFSVATTGPDGAELIVKLYGRDAHDAALLSTVRRTIWLRQPGAPVGFGRLRQVEHEAFLTLLARQRGVPTDVVVTAGATDSDDAVLVLQRTGSLVVEPDRQIADQGPIDPRFEGASGAARLAELWSLAADLHAGGISHGLFDEEHLIVDEGRFGLVDFRGATVAPTDTQLRADDVQLFITTVLLAGRDAAIAALVAARSTEQIESIIPYLQSTALTPDQRRMIGTIDLDLDAVRAELAEAIDVAPPPLVQLRRFSVGSMIRIALPLLAVFMLVSALAGFDLQAFVDTLQGANWWLVVAGLVVAQTPRIAQAVSTLGAAPIPLPLGPVYALQLAISYVNLAIPTAASRIAVNVRFFQRQGVTPSAAIATGALDGFSGFIVQAMLLTSLLLLTPASLDLEFGDPTAAAAKLAWLIALVVIVLLLVLSLVPNLRRWMVPRIRASIREAIHVLRGLRSLRRLVMLFGGNLVAEILFATTLGIFVEAFGYSVSLQQLLVINMTVALLSGLIPVPGGIGVTEGGLIVGLTSAGVPQETAFAAVILYRLATFYLPPIWGFFSLRWLERNSYL
jgi:uncharacterized protein (TIRG00374 family)